MTCKVYDVTVGGDMKYSNALRCATLFSDIKFDFTLARKDWKEQFAV
jgi:hypothetical protein